MDRLDGTVENECALGDDGVGACNEDEVGGLARWYAHVQACG